MFSLNVLSMLNLWFFKGCGVKIIIIHKIRVDTQHEYTTTQYIIIDTQTDNSYIYMCFNVTHISKGFTTICQSMCQCSKPLVYNWKSFIGYKKKIKLHEQYDKVL